MSYVLRTFGLSKCYKGNWALSKVNMNIEKGDIYGFVGENGSGKTTIIRLITGLISPNEGSFELFGASNDSPKILEARRRVGAIVESPSIYLNMSARNNLKMQCDILGIKDEEKIKRALMEVGLFDMYESKKQASNFSLGMRQRLGIAMALIGEPEFIILDEPMNGLDPAGIVEIRELILNLNKEKGITFLISSHILTELALVATKYGIISKGQMVVEISAQELQNQCKQSIYLEVDSPIKLFEVLIQTMDEKNLALEPKGVRVYGNIHLNWLFTKALDAGLEIQNVVTTKGSIEDYYLSHIGGNHNA
ncbi:MAG: ATP-binding cassette domain-containing protein [Clostridia bacterium]|nr:ATP-binding cassette domain-containing protein [Clostridia bacterium]